MNGPTLLRPGALAIGLGAAPLALAQVPPLAVMPPQWGFVGMMAGFGMLMVLGIIAITVFTNNRAQRDRLALVEKLVTDGKPVPRELMVNEPRQLTLPEEYRRDVRRGIAFLCWGIGISVVFYIVSGGNPRAAAWGLLFIVPGLGNFLKAWLTARDIARGAAGGPR
jgi:hypothetical protein